MLVHWNKKTSKENRTAFVRNKLVCMMLIVGVSWDVHPPGEQEEQDQEEKNFGGPHLQRTRRAHLRSQARYLHEDEIESHFPVGVACALTPLPSNISVMVRKGSSKCSMCVIVPKF